MGIILMELRDYFGKNGLPDTDLSANIEYDPGEHIRVMIGDITQSDCMCVVNAANETLLGGGGVDGAIHMAAGPELLEECKALNGCNTGEAKITKGYNLKAKYIIHTVGPRYPMDNHENLLRQAYISSLDLAKQYGITSIAFPAISTGKFSYPKKEATRIAVETVSGWIKDHPDYSIDIIFTCVDRVLYDYYCEFINEYTVKI